jgi:hypothetical protein
LGTSLSDYVRVYANCPVLLSRTTDWYSDIEWLNCYVDT